MRRDYFTCVFLGLIAGALTFVCFKPLYFTWNQIIPRDFTLFERLMSVLYTLFFIFFLPCFAAFKKKEWINWGLAAYGILAYFPLWFYPAPELIKGDNADMLHIFGSLCLRAIYAVMQAPFAALSRLIGDNAASKVVYWLLPVAIFWPILLRVIRFYRLAYLSEQLNPMTPDQASPKAARKPEISGKPEVLGTVISAPVTAQTPADITRKHLPSFKSEDKAAINAPAAEEKPALKDGLKTKPRTGVRAPVRPAHIGAPEKKPVEALGAGAPAEEKKNDAPIELSAPKPKADEAIPMPPPKPKADDVIQLGAPDSGNGGVIELGGPSGDNEH